MIVKKTTEYTRKNRRTDWIFCLFFRNLNTIRPPIYDSDNEPAPFNIETMKLAGNLGNFDFPD